MSRRSPEEWHRLLEAHGWQDYTGLARRLRCSVGSVKAGASRAREWAARATGDEVATTPGKSSGKITPTHKAPVLDGLTLDQAVVVEATLAGRTVSEAAAAAGVARETASRWLNHDPLVAAAVASLRAERHIATVSALTVLAQELVSHHSAAARLARLLIDQAAARIAEGPPRMPDAGMSEAEVDNCLTARRVWQFETNAAIGQAVRAAALLNSSPILATGGYPKTERHEVAVTNADDLADRPMEELDAIEAELSGRLRLIEGGQA